MKINNWIVVVCAFWTIGALSSAFAEDDPALQKEIEAAERKWCDAWNKRDPEGLANMYVNDAQRFEPDVGILKGRDAIRRFFQESMKEAGDAVETATTLDVSGHGDEAIETGTWRDERPDGSADEGTYLEIWQKDNGKWKVRREIWNRTRETVKLKEFLKPLERLLGTWVAEGDVPEGKIRSSISWKPAVGGNAILSEGKIWIGGKLDGQWSNLMYYNPETKTLADAGVSNNGHGTSIMVLKGNKLVAQGNSVEHDGQHTEVNELVLDGDVLRFTQLSLFIDGERRENLIEKVEFRRQ